MLKPIDLRYKFLVLEASEKAIYDTDVAIGPNQVMGLPVFPRWESLANERIEFKELDRK